MTVELNRKQRDSRNPALLGALAITLASCALPGCSTDIGQLSDSGIVTFQGREITTPQDMPSRLITKDGEEFVQVTDELCTGFTEKTVEVLGQRYVLVDK